MFLCTINDFKAGECILTRYPNGSYGTVIIDEVDKLERVIHTHENYGSEDKVRIYYPRDYDPQIYKFRREWDNEENTPNDIRHMLVSNV